MEKAAENPDSLSDFDLSISLGEIKKQVEGLMPDWQSRMATNRELSLRGGDFIRIAKYSEKVGEIEFGIEAESPHGGKIALDAVNLTVISPAGGKYVRLQFGYIPQIHVLTTDSQSTVLGSSINTVEARNKAVDVVHQFTDSRISSLPPV